VQGDLEVEEAVGEEEGVGVEMVFHHPYTLPH
jgi:hypothetical protein